MTFEEWFREMHLADKHKDIMRFAWTAGQCAFFGSKEQQEEMLKTQKEWIELDVQRKKLENNSF